MPIKVMARYRSTVTANIIKVYWYNKYVDRAISQYFARTQTRAAKPLRSYAVGGGMPAVFT